MLKDRLKSVYPLFVILSIVLAFLLFIEYSLHDSQYKALEASKNQSKIERIIERHTDTLKVLDTVLKYKIKQIEVEPDTVIIHKVDSVYGVTDTIHLGRELLKCKDSLDICQTKVKIDTEVINKIDTVVKTIVTEKPKSTLEKIQASSVSFGLGTLVGITLRSLF